ncbi:MAG: hypothetical protein ABR537_07755 [Gemmatimonadales bacterium]
MRLPWTIVALCVAVAPAVASQARTSPPAAPVTFAATYRGFTPGRSYREFAERARALAQRDTLRCNTSRKTAQLMECGVLIRDPGDSARFYLSAYVLEGKIAMVSFTDSGGPPLVQWARRDLTNRFGPAQRRERSMLEWTSGRRVARLNWRGAGNARWISITLRDDDVMDHISKYVQRPVKRSR